MPVADIDRATAFYRDGLGMRFLFQAPPGLSFFDCAGIRLMLDEPASAGRAECGSVIYYRVADLDAAFRSLSGRGVSFEATPHLVARLPDHDRERTRSEYGAELHREKIDRSLTAGEESRVLPSATYLDLAGDSVG